MLNLPARFTADQLKAHYKALARQLHPDKRARHITLDQATATFQVLTHAYEMLRDAAAAAAADRQHDELRAASRAAAKTQQQQVPTMRPPAPSSAASSSATGGGGAVLMGGRFSLSRFNQEFSKHRVTDPELDGGYGDWMRKAVPEAHQLERETQARQLIKYEEPEPAVLGARRATGYTELGVTQVSDYSRAEAATGRRGVQYTDYRVAHTTSKLVDEALAADRPEYKSIDHIKKARAKLSYDMSPDDAQREAERRRELEEAEERRQAACRMRDADISERYRQAHMAMLGYGPSANE